VHHRLFVCAHAHEQKTNVQGSTTVVNIAPGSERLSASGLKVCAFVGWGPAQPEQRVGQGRQLAAAAA
jgi:hypothetical protein